jgi:pyruvate kinase
LAERPRRTKIVATLGPSSSTRDVLTRMVEAGLDVARFNLSHGSAARHTSVLDTLRESAESRGRRVGVLFDLQGPEVRLGVFAAGQVTLRQDQTFVLTTAQALGTAERVSVNYPLPALCLPGDQVLLDDGNIALEVVEVRAAGAAGPAAGRDQPDAPGGEVITVVRVGGVLGDRKKVNVPGRRLDVPFMNPKDETDIGMAVTLGADFVAASFVRRAEDIHAVRDFLTARGGRQMIVAKIECQEALDNLGDIIAAADGLMVARGDLGVEVPAEDVPIIQKDLIARAMVAGKPVITATQMLESMVEHPRPTRAEASDVANAIFDGTDAVMLSAETATGSYPVEAVAMMARIARRAESALGLGRIARRPPAAAFPAPAVPGVTESISLATVAVADSLGAGAIVTATASGFTARMVARHRPAAPIIAVTSSEVIARQQTLTWGVYPVRVDEAATTDEMFNRAATAARQSGLVDPGSLIVITAGAPPGNPGTTNLLKVHTLGSVIARGKGLFPASATGRVRICRTSGEAQQKVTKGDVLVAPALGEDWLPAMAKALAWVAEDGGEAAFAAEQARALERAAVVGVAGALSLLPDGELVTLDGARGLVYEGKAVVL